ncbi:hypothetical protein Spica_2474 [Gracilinema caldarium DSM 7334]|uniref:Uncharacterized protein n=1 Tax=Gracilinema caldarium (strain ATCC 51460 / DSM 7334 / H1) TaxID=744872 RepID=F8F4D2_GRAC1|nr:hypothetical protein Spica_2474 [Gracilinema caldarium DSM 7334]
MNDSDGPGSSQPPEPHLCVQLCSTQRSKPEALLLLSACL